MPYTRPIKCRFEHLIRFRRSTMLRMQPKPAHVPELGQEQQALPQPEWYQHCEFVKISGASDSCARNWWHASEIDMAHVGMRNSS